MQKQKCVISFLMLVLGFILLYSCEKVTLIPPPIVIGVDSIRFSADIKPIFSICKDCHPALHQPDLSTNPYKSLTDGGYIDIALPSQSKFYVHVTNGGSHKQVSPVEKLKIIQWITQGAKNN